MLWGPAGLQLPGPRSSHLCASRLRLPGHSPTVWAAHNRNVIAPSPGGRTLRRWCRQGTFFSVLGVETAVPSPCPQGHPSACLCPDLLFLQGPQSCGVRTHPRDFTLSRSPLVFFFFSSTSLLLPTHLPPPSCTHAQSCNPMDFSPPDSSVHGFFQARILEWVAISFSRSITSLKAHL